MDSTLDSPAENLALDEALLLEAEAGRLGPSLRFWSSPLPFIVVGMGARVEEEVFRDACTQHQIPVLRRCSGGGTVMQGPGCLNYALVLRIDATPSLKTIREANRFIMERNAHALAGILQRPVQVQGHTDLVVAGRKVSGNAQRRLRHHLLFHGTFLLHLDLQLIGRFLPPPLRQPAYRAQRTHDQFVANLYCEATEVKRALCAAWNVPESKPPHPPTAQLDPPSLKQRVQTLVQTRYALEEWNLRL